MSDLDGQQVTALATEVAPSSRPLLESLGAPEFTFTRRHGIRRVPHYVYVVHGSIGYSLTLYVGQTANPSSRLTSHSKQSLWWRWMRRVDFYRCEDRPEALSLERRLIRELAPRYNVVHNDYPAVDPAA